MAIKRKLSEKKANQTISENNFDQKETDDTPIKRSNKNFKFSDANSPAELQELTESNDIEKKEDETELSDELLYDDTHVDDLVFTNPSETLGDTSDPSNSGEAP